MQEGPRVTRSSIITPQTRLKSFIMQRILPPSSHELYNGKATCEKGKSSKAIKQFLSENFLGYCKYIEVMWDEDAKETFRRNNLAVVDPSLFHSHVAVKIDDIKIKTSKVIVPLSEKEIRREESDAFSRDLSPIKPYRKAKKTKIANKSEAEDDKKLDALFKKYGMDEEPGQKEESNDDAFDALFKELGFDEKEIKSSRKFTPTFRQIKSTNFDLTEEGSDKKVKRPSRKYMN